MLSTRQVPVPEGIVLPYYTRRTWLMSFWLVMSLGGGALIALLLWGMTLPQRIALGSAGAVLLAAPGILRPYLAVLPMRAWNRLARLFARAATLWITGVYFFVVLIPLGRLGSALRLAPPAGGGSLWTPWRAEPPDENEISPGIVRTRSSRNGWFADFAAWTRRPGNTWTWSLLPFLLMLSNLQTTRDMEAPPEGIYTLY